MVNISSEERLARLEDVNEIQKVMSKYAFLLSACRMEEVVKLFANRNDSTASIGSWGLYKGFDSIKKMFCGTMPEGGVEGFMTEHTITTPIVEVARDGKTAKGVWMSPGHETYDKKMTGRVVPTWGWTKYAADFIQENGKWKIWHFWNFPSLIVEVGKSWADGGKPTFLKRVDASLMLKPDATSPYPNRTEYDPNSKPQFLPAFPEPYETYDANVDWIDPRNNKK